MTGLLWTGIALAVTLALGSLGMGLTLAARLRELNEGLRRLADPMGNQLPAAGEPVPEFAVVTTTGDRLSAVDLAGPETLVLFLTDSCGSCWGETRTLQEARFRSADGVGRPIAFLIGEPEQQPTLASQLEPVARVVTHSYGDGLAGRFGVRGFPAVLVVSGGIVRQAAHSLDDLQVGVAP